MIFVTVGTHEQQFNRLIKEVDRLKKEKLIDDDVFIQTGFSDYEPKYCQWSNMISYEDMEKYIDQTDIIITHGGPATFMGVLAKGKTPIVVPRQYQYGEHVNDHQVEFLKQVESIYNLIGVFDVNDLAEAIVDGYRNQVKLVSNHTNFMNGFAEIISEIV